MFSEIVNKYFSFHSYIQEIASSFSLSTMLFLQLQRSVISDVHESFKVDNLLLN